VSDKNTSCKYKKRSGAAKPGKGLSAFSYAAKKPVRAVLRKDPAKAGCPNPFVVAFRRS